jgi:hypothetical protein
VRSKFIIYIFLAASLGVTVVPPVALSHGKRHLPHKPIGHIPVFPWKDGDETPGLCGVNLGESLSAVASAIGMPEFIERPDSADGQEYVTYGGHGPAIWFRHGYGVTAIRISYPGVATFGGLRTGDNFSDVFAKWGKPAAGSAVNPVTYTSGNWAVEVYSGMATPRIYAITLRYDLPVEAGHGRITPATGKIPSTDVPADAPVIPHPPAGGRPLVSPGAGTVMPPSPDQLSGNTSN